jgi:hypothetical protein
MLILGLVFLGLVIASIGVGFIAAQYGGKINLQLPVLNVLWATRGPQVSASVYIISGIAMGFIVFFLLSNLQKVVPTKDAPGFQQRQQFGIQRDQISIVREQRCQLPQRPTCSQTEREVSRVIDIAVVFPPTVPVQTDFSMSLQLASDPDPIPAGMYSVSLYGPKYLESRTTTPCKHASDDSAAVPACHQVGYDSEPIMFMWTSTPTKTGLALVTLKSELLARLFDRKVPRTSKLTIKVSQGDFVDELPSELPVSIGAATVDPLNKEIQFQIRVLTTLGVSQDTYDWLTVLGTVVGVLGTLLGAGFALNLFHRAKPGNPTAQNGKSTSNP